MKFGDKVRFRSIGDIKANLINIESELNSSAATLPIGQINDFVGFSFRNLITYSALLVDRLISTIDQPIEFSAWTARNLFECYLISVYIVTDPLKAKEFLVQKASDELEINEGILSLKNVNTKKETLKPIHDRIEHIKTTMKNHGLIQSKHWTVSMLANQTGNKDEYDAFFKLYSKYVHPSSWLINGKTNEFDNLTYKNIFLIQAQYYADCILKIASDYKKGKSKN